jgi:alkanesulfonate monooxygenase SsuD/methylene tetrahydromethanopterin reductase-like flavin-dependent oxidoreductase (luciferase family)
MRLGTIVLQTRPWTGTAQAFRTAEEIGYDVVYVADHLTHPTLAGRWLADGFTTLAAAAMVTSRVDLGTLVASAAVRTPVTLARAAATLDDVSGGRLVLGLGAGAAGDAAADRGSSPAQREMTARMADTGRALEAVWAGEPDFGGDHAAYRGVLTTPTAPGRARPYTMLAAHGPRGLALTARYADAWSTGTVRPLTDAASYVAVVERAESIGLDEVVVYWPDEDPGGRFWSDPDVHAEALTRLAR